MQFCETPSLRWGVLPAEAASMETSPDSTYCNASICCARSTLYTCGHLPLCYQRFGESNVLINRLHFNPFVN